VDTSFFQPLLGLADASPHARSCPEFSDDAFVRLGVQRVLESSESGRAFLQEHGLRFPETPAQDCYFASFQSQRRLELLTQLGSEVRTAAEAILRDRLADIPELAGFECFAIDGHWHKAAAHDARHDGVKMAVGHFYSLNLRTHAAQHLAAGEGLHEHDMSALRRVTPRGLRQQVPQGRRVLVVYDTAGIGYRFWKRCRQECAVYFLSCTKENLVFEWLESVEWDRTDARNHGVTEDRRVMAEGKHKLRIVFYTDPCTGKSYEFLTNVMELPPGVIAELYRRRWELEKVYDEFKNKLNERKAWGSSLVAKTAQAQLIALTHNLLLVYEQELERRHGVTNKAEDKRRARQTKEKARDVRQGGEVIVSPRCGGAAGHPAQREVHPMAAALPPASGCGRHRRAPPQGPICDIIDDNYQHSCIFAFNPSLA
jgi:hypothetical protein